MNHSTLRRLAVYLPAAALIAACTRAPAGAMRQMDAPIPVPSGSTTPDAIARARADSAFRPYTEADIHFMTGMISHHAQAIVMARWAERHGASESVRTLAGRIINAQTDEIVAMQRWLRDRQLPVPDARPMGTTMTMNGMTHEMLMPGMLTAEQMAELDRARNADFDRLFLRDMIQHHEGAISMVRALFATYGAAQDELVFKFATDVNVDQTTEIARMQSMLARILFGPDR